MPSLRDWRWTVEVSRISKAAPHLYRLGVLDHGGDLPSALIDYGPPTPSEDDAEADARRVAAAMVALGVGEDDISVSSAPALDPASGRPQRLLDFSDLPTSEGAYRVLEEVFGAISPLPAYLYDTYGLPPGGTSTERLLRISPPADGLLVEVVPGAAPDEEIAAALARLSVLYRRLGGSGITFDLEGVVAVPNREDAL